MATLLDPPGQFGPIFSVQRGQAIDSRGPSPWLICATRRVLSNAFTRDRSINRCRLRTLRCSPALAAVKMRCRNRRTSASTLVQLIWSQSSTRSCDPFTVTEVAASNVPADADATINSPFTNSPDPRGLPLGPSTLPVSDRFDLTTARRWPFVGDALPVAFRRIGVRFSGHPVPGWDLRLPHGRPTSPQGLDPDGVSTFHMR